MNKKTRQRNYLIKELDDLARTRCFERDYFDGGTKCIRCRSGQNLQWAHVVTRSCLVLRWDLWNNMTLCAGCHLWWHKEPIEAIAWFAETWPKRYEYLTTKRRMKIKVDLKDLLVGMRIGAGEACCD